jgi:hypothetical protein
MVRGSMLMPAGSAAADLERQTDRLAALTSAVRAVEARYVVTGQDPTAALQKFPDLLRDITAVTAETSARLHSPGAGDGLRAFADATSRLAEADAAAREQLVIGDVQSASQIIFSDADRAADAMTSAVLQIREAARAERLQASSATSRQNVTLVASVAGLWVLGLLLLAFVPARQRQGAPVGDDALGEPSMGSAISISAAADLCTELSRVETGAALNGLLARAVTLLEADGVIVWMESGEELLVAAAAGYPLAMTSRLSSIRRHDDNMTAAAWRDGLTEVVAGGEQSSAAIAVPLFSGHTCRGVFTLELRAGREPDDAALDVARMIAAQLASVVVGTVNAASPPALAGN